VDNALELVFVAFIVVVLVVTAVYFAWRQWQTLRTMPEDNLSPEDRRYQCAQAWRRLVGSVLMIVLAGLLVGSYWTGQERQAENSGKERLARGEDEERPEPNAEQKRFLTQYSIFWIIFGLILLSWMGLALFDIWAIRRFALRHYRRIQEDKREMIERQVARLRSQRNGHG
jgi:hypothetical protein